VSAPETLTALIAKARAEAAAREAVADDLAARFLAVRFRVPGRDLRFLAGIDTDPDGVGWRVTSFDGRGPIGHTCHRSLREAIVDALQRGGQPEA
jgi:hypothetical protein